MKLEITETFRISMELDEYERLELRALLRRAQGDNRLPVFLFDLLEDLS